jgi:hypothetical protein
VQDTVLISTRTGLRRKLQYVDGKKFGQAACRGSCAFSSRDKKCASSEDGDPAEYCEQREHECLQICRYGLRCHRGG